MTSTIRDTQTAQYPSQWLDIFRVITLKWWFLPVSLEALQCPPPSTDLTPVTPSFHICKVKQKCKGKTPLLPSPGCCSCTRHPSHTCPLLKCCGLYPIQQQELLPDALSATSHPAVPNAQPLAMPQPPLNPPGQSPPDCPVYSHMPAKQTKHLNPCKIRACHHSE